MNELINLFLTLTGALVPFIARSILRNTRKSRRARFLELHGSIERLEEIRRTYANHHENPGMPERVEQMILEAESELKSLSPRKAVVATPLPQLSFFYYLTSVECVFLILFYFTLPPVRALISGLSWQNRVFFFEGIFASSTARILLVLMFLIGSLLLTIRASRLMKKKVEKNLPFNMMTFVLFNILFVIITVTASSLLSWIDPYVPFF